MGKCVPTYVGKICRSAFRLLLLSFFRRKIIKDYIKYFAVETNVVSTDISTYDCWMTKINILEAL